MIEEIAELFQRARSGDTDLLLENLDLAVQEEDEPLLHELARNIDASKVAALLTCPEITKVWNFDTGNTPLHILASRGFPEVLAHPQVATLLDAAKRVPLHYFVDYAPIEKAVLALEHPDVANVHCMFGRGLFGDTPLHILAERGCVDVLNHPQVATAKNHKNWTPLHALACRGLTEVCSHPEVARVKNILNQTPLHALAYSGNDEIVDYPEELLRVTEVGIVKDCDGRTPLHILAGLGCLKILVHPLVATVADNSGRTPLHELAGTGEKEVLLHPMIASVKDIAGETPLHVFAFAEQLQKRPSVLRHPEATIVKDNSGLTPEDILMGRLPPWHPIRDFWPEEPA